MSAGYADGRGAALTGPGMRPGVMRVRKRLAPRRTSTENHRSCVDTYMQACMHVHTHIQTTHTYTYMRTDMLLRCIATACYDRGCHDYHGYCRHDITAFSSSDVGHGGWHRTEPLLQLCIAASSHDRACHHYHGYGHRN